MSQQSMAALHVANAVRLAAAEVRSLLVLAPSQRAGRDLLASLLEAFPPGGCATAPIHVLVESIPRVGDDLADRWLTAAGIFGHRTLGDLTYGQRSALAALLRCRSTGEAHAA